MFGDRKSGTEGNGDGKVHVWDKWGREILLDDENMVKKDDENGDGLYDMGGREEYNVEKGWVYKGKE